MLRHSYKKFAAFLLAGTTAFCSLTACGQKEVVLDSSVASPAPAAPAVSDSIANLTMPQKGDEIVVLTIRDYGDVKIRLFPDQTAKGTENFKTLVKNGFYDELIFHRVVDQFVIQGGDPKGDGTGGEDAWGSKDGFTQTISPQLCHVTGAVAYAIGKDKMNKSQFYIVTGEMQTADRFTEYRNRGYSFTPEAEALYKSFGGVPYLDGGYEVFGQVFEGMEYVLEIQKTAVNANGKPMKPVVIEKAVVTEYDGAPPHWLTANGQPYTAAT
jgi:cyclophilin family peptidyl-prolyl cis-trans isomerase